VRGDESGNRREEVRKNFIFSVIWRCNIALNHRVQNAIPSNAFTINGGAISELNRRNRKFCTALLYAGRECVQKNS